MRSGEARCYADWQPDDLFLSGRIGLHEAFDHFKTDLWMSSLTESSEWAEPTR